VKKRSISTQMRLLQEAVASGVSLNIVLELNGHTYDHLRYCDDTIHQPSQGSFTTSADYDFARHEECLDCFYC